MKDFFRQSMSWLHTWAGLALGWLLFFIFVTGTAGYFDTEIDRWMHPELKAASAHGSEAELLSLALKRLESKADGADRWLINLPADRNTPYLRLYWQPAAGSDGKRAPGVTELLDPATGEPQKLRPSSGGQLLYRMHWRLHYLPVVASKWIVGIATMFMLAALVTGIIVHRRIFSDFFTFRPGKGQRSWLDAHNVLSVASLPFQLMITYSGLIFLAFTYLPLVTAAHYGPGEAGRESFSEELFERGTPVQRADTPVPISSLQQMLAQANARWSEGRVSRFDVRYPGDANARVLVRHVLDTPLRNSEAMVFEGSSGALLEIIPAVPSAAKAARDVFLGLHEGLFAGPLLRWLYFLSGFAGAAMIATGLVLWTVKRRQRIEKEGRAPHFGLRLVERLNVGTIVGLPIGIAAYFWANRLLPAELAGRAAWEAHALFIVWALLLLHASLRPAPRAWVEQLSLAAAAFGLLPLLNALTTGQHPGVSLAAGDWVFVGFDLTVCGLAVLFAIAARQVARKSKKGMALEADAPRRLASAVMPGHEQIGGRS